MWFIQRQYSDSNLLSTNPKVWHVNHFNPGSTVYICIFSKQELSGPTQLRAILLLARSRSRVKMDSSLPSSCSFCFPIQAHWVGGWASGPSTKHNTTVGQEIQSPGRNISSISISFAQTDSAHSQRNKFTLPILFLPFLCSLWERNKDLFVNSDVLLFMCRAAEQRALEIMQRTKTSLPTYLITSKCPSVAVSSKSTISCHRDSITFQRDFSKRYAIHLKLTKIEKRENWKHM